MSIGIVKVVAIVEREYLIAIDIDRIIADNFNCKVHVIMPDEAQEALVDIKCDVLILDAEISHETLSSFIPVITGPDSLVALLTVSDVDPKSYMPFPYHAVIAKPFTDGQVIEKLTPLLSA